MQNLYIIRCQDYFKIGVANDVETRLAQLSTGNPYPLEVEVIYQFENAEVVERAIHQKYKTKRVRGEWFNLDYDDQKDIHKICLMLGANAYEYTGENPTDETIADAENVAELPEGGKWDYAAMFAEGWKIGVQDSRGVYWNWKKTIEGGRKTIYGGCVSELPYTMDEMRRRYGGQ